MCGGKRLWIGSQRTWILGSDGLDSNPMTDEARRDWEIRIVREAISEDWASLASNKLNAEQRRALRDHLSLHIAALRDLAERLPAEDHHG